MDTRCAVTTSGTTSAEAHGSFYQKSTQEYGVDYDKTHSAKFYILGLDASKSSPVYGKSTKVQPQAVKVLIYIKIN